MMAVFLGLCKVGMTGKSLLKNVTMHQQTHLGYLCAVAAITTRTVQVRLR